MIEIQGLVKRYHTQSRGIVHAVKDVQLRVAKGEIFGLLGPNGAGKTTTLRMLATLVQPDAGRISVCGTDCTSQPLKVREHISYVPAEGGLPDRLTPREVIRLYARIQGARQPQALSEKLLEQMGALRYADMDCGELSTGMKRRVVLARALVNDPDVLLLDEPTDGLDVSGRRDVLALIRALAKQGRAIIVSSHIMTEVERVVDRVGLMFHGEMVAQGSIDDVLKAVGGSNLEEAFLQLEARVHDP